MGCIGVRVLEQVVVLIVDQVHLGLLFALPAGVVGNVWVLHHD